MAAPMSVALRLTRTASKLSVFVGNQRLALPWLDHVRHSRYPPHYSRPIINKDAYLNDNLPIDISVPVQAAKVNVSSSSLVYDPLIDKFINIMNKKGKKQTVKKIMDTTLEMIKKEKLHQYNSSSEVERSGIETNPRVIFHKAIENCKPLTGLAVVKKGGKNYQVPTPLTPSRRRFLSMKWILEECKTKPLKVHMANKLSQELLDAYSNKGKVVKRKQELHKQCEANRAYAHFRWW